MKLNALDAHSAMLISTISEDILTLRNSIAPTRHLGIYYTNGVQRKSVIKDVRTVLNEYDSVIESSNNTYQTLETEGRLFIKKI